MLNYVFIAASPDISRGYVCYIFSMNSGSLPSQLPDWSRDPEELQAQCHSHRREYRLNSVIYCDRFFRIQVRGHRQFPIHTSSSYVVVTLNHSYLVHLKHLCYIHISQSPNSKITNLFKNTNLEIAYRSSTAIFKQLKLYKTEEEEEEEEMYQMNCSKCTGRQIQLFFEVNLINSKTNNPHQHVHYIY